MSGEDENTAATEGAWLLTMNDWLATRKEPWSREYTHQEERVVAFYATGSLTDALEKAREYEHLFMKKYTMNALTLRLLSFSFVPDGTDPDALVALGVTHLDECIERLREELAP